MKNYKYKYMNETMIAEIDELWNNGHKNALYAYGMECANAGITGYKRGYAIGSALVLGAAGVTMAAVYAVVKIKEKRALMRAFSAGRECTEKNLEK
jgi:hypothetical protein